MSDLGQSWTVRFAPNADVLGPAVSVRCSAFFSAEPIAATEVDADRS
jgi:hypothetical protein